MQPSRNISRPAAPNVRRDFFVYSILFSINADTATEGAIQIQADSDFELQKLSMFATIAAAAQTEATRVLPLVTVQLTDTGTGRSVFNTPAAIPALFGDGRIPFILPTTKVFSANASVTVAVANFSTATDYDTLRILLIGSKLFSYS